MQRSVLNRLLLARRLFELARQGFSWAAEIAAPLTTDTNDDTRRSRRACAPKKRGGWLICLEGRTMIRRPIQDYFFFGTAIPQSGS
jgi:hypothetical protein